MTETLMTLGNSLLVVMTLLVVSRVGLCTSCSLMYSSRLSWLVGSWYLDFYGKNAWYRIKD